MCYDGKEEFTKGIGVLVVSIVVIVQKGGNAMLPECKRRVLNRTEDVYTRRS